MCPLRLNPVLKNNVAPYGGHQGQVERWEAKSGLSWADAVNLFGCTRKNEKAQWKMCLMSGVLGVSCVSDVPGAPCMSGMSHLSSVSRASGLGVY